MALSPVKAGSVGRNKPAINCELPTYFVASWKGLEFFCDNSNDEFGRRGDIYEYPLGDDTGYKDLGRRARRFKLEGYLIGANQVGDSFNMRYAAESPEPGMLIHPLWGEERVACVTLAISADYRKDRRRTRLSFEFVEANESWAPYPAGQSAQSIFDNANAAIEASKAVGNWEPSAADIAAANGMDSVLAGLINPNDQRSFDAADMLQTTQEQAPPGWSVGAISAPLSARVPITMAQAATLNRTFNQHVDAVDFASATIRRIHLDALTRLRDWNAYVVQRSQGGSANVQALVVTYRLILIRDFAVSAAQKTYETVKDALDDLDFIMTVYDEEEAIAARKCDDVLVAAIRRARATAVHAILLNNIRLPGVAEYPIDGLWPSLVAAHKLYGDGRRFMQVEAYNPTQPPMWMGRVVIAPAR